MICTFLLFTFFDPTEAYRALSVRWDLVYCVDQCPFATGIATTLESNEIKKKKKSVKSGLKPTSSGQRILGYTFVGPTSQ